MSTPIIPTRELSLKFDKLSNNLYDAQNIYNTKINTNERLIEQNMETNYKQEVQNNVLKIITLAFFIIMIVVLLYRLKVFDSLMILVIIIISILVLAMLFIYYVYYLSDYNSYLERISRSTAKKLENNTVPIGNELNCEDEENVVGNALLKDTRSTGTSLQSNYNRLLQSTDSNFDVWAKGDHISTNNINNNNTKNVDLDIMDYRMMVSNDGKSINITDVTGKFNGLQGSAITYEECEYTGANHNGMPLQNKYMYSSIPCKYYVNYKSNGLYTKDSNGKYIKTKSGL